MCNGEAIRVTSVDIVMTKTDDTNAYCKCIITQNGATELFLGHNEASSIVERRVNIVSFHIGVDSTHVTWLGLGGRAGGRAGGQAGGRGGP
ncbi:hypothetical protein NP493_5835g00000 [Ridgeia piscesae]|uniref:Uncharacterized protein n=1 Tax=Ridgeia piscesae TaxID=27915 RepID=A0AAD9MRG5_RIDPI|nr:hypothetical protein NP493_5835g00000 [Ridgeia piscesae]